MDLYTLRHGKAEEKTGQLVVTLVENLQKLVSRKLRPFQNH